jgi:peptide/nickel transport system ATP-binding protein
MSTPLIEVKDLSVHFSRGGKLIPAVDQLSFGVARGETLGLVGQSGSGKSVTALSLMRLLGINGKISSGEVIYRRTNPVNLLSLQEKEMRRYRGKEISMIFQEPMTSLNPVLRCGEQVEENLITHLRFTKKQAKQSAMEWLVKVQLPEPERIYFSYPHQLSGGQRQRVMIAMALCANPSLLIADEPTTSLDVTVQSGIVGLLRDLRQQFEMSMIFISHDLGLVAQMADRVMVMQAGKLVEEGTVDQVLQSPKNSYTRALLTCRPSLKTKQVRLPAAAEWVKESSGPQINAGETPVDLMGVNEISSSQIVTRLQQLSSLPPLLSVENLTVKFPVRKNLLGTSREYVHAVKDVSFRIFPGETLGLVGESGCGKTTLGRAMLQLIKPSSGKIFYRGRELGSLQKGEIRRLRKEVQIIFQDPYSSLNPRLTAGYALMEPLRVHAMGADDGERKRLALEWFEKVKLPADSFHRYPHEFSGGQRQRISIARALVLRPQFLVCDEIVSSLDTLVQARVLNLLLDLRDEMNFTCLFISHDLAVVKFMSDRMAVMREGRIEEMIPSHQLHTQPVSAYTQQLLAAIPGENFSSGRLTKQSH